MALDNTEFKMTITDSYADILADNAESAGISGDLSSVMPNQLWRGYWDKDVFDSTSDKPSGIQFFNFGTSVSYHACGICCCIAASQILTGQVYTMYDLYQKNLFVWYKNIKDAYGRTNGAMLAKFPMMNKIGIKCETKGVHYDAEREYSWCKKNSAYTKTPSSPTISASNFFIPTSGQVGYKATYN